MKLHTLKPAEGAVKTRKRIGRGQGSGRGGTSTRGHKGDRSRSGSFWKFNFEGGQMPMARRLPKYGFKNPFRVEYAVLNLSDLERIAAANPGKELNVDLFYATGAVADSKQPVKILADGKLTQALTVSAHRLSGAAKEAITQAGGSFTELSPRAAEESSAE
jgi:large subunit ribosomal protein L15